MPFALSGKSLLQTPDQSLGIRWHAQQVCGLLKRVVVGTGEQHCVTTPGGTSFVAEATWLPRIS